MSSSWTRSGQRWRENWRWVAGRLGQLFFLDGDKSEKKHQGHEHCSQSHRCLALPPYGQIMCVCERTHGDDDFE